MSSRTGIDALFFRLLPIVAAFVFPLSVFSKDDIQTYRIPKQKQAMPAPASESTTKAKPLAWTLPQGWQEVAPSGVRVAAFAIPGKNGAKAELSVMPFPGTVGGELSNVNRWRREVGLDAIAEDAVTSQPVQVGADAAKLYEVAGPKVETLVAWLVKDETSWFFKMRGDKAAVSEAKPAFVEFLKSIRFLAAPSLQAANAVADNPVANPHGGALPAGHPPMGAELPAGHPVIGASDTTSASAIPNQNASDLPAWKIPSHWKEQPATRMVLKSYTAGEGSSGKAIITITSFPGDVGGLLANVNRWRAQLGLNAIAESDLTKFTQSLETKNGKATLVQMDAASKPVRLVGVILPRDSDTWFYKMVGDLPAVDREKTNLVNLVQTARYP